MDRERGRECVRVCERERDTIIWLLLKTEHSVGGAAGFDREGKKKAATGGCV